MKHRPHEPMHRERRQCRIRGFTLIELVAALGITAILLGAMTSMVMLAGKAVPAPNDVPSSAITAGGAVDQLAGELETALLVLEQTPTSITFTIPPRNQDKYPEKIHYSWAGTSGAPLLRQYNSGSPAIVIPQADQFSLTPVVATSTESYSGAATEDATDSLLIDYSGSNGLIDLNVSPSLWQGQYFASNSWPAGVVGWRPTRVMFQGKQSGLLGSTNIQIRPALAGLIPSNTVTGQYSILGTGLLSSYSWQQFTFSGLDRLAPSAGICLVLQGTLGLPNSMTVEGNSGAGLVQTADGGSTWTYASNRSMQSRLYGTLTHAGPTQYAVSKYLGALGIGLRAGPSGNPMVTTTVQTLNHPELLSAYWELKFDKDPTTVDVNGDGKPDWAVRGGGSSGLLSLLNGLLQTNGATLDSQPGDNFAQLTVVDLRFGATTSGSWAEFSVNAARSGATCAPVLARITLQSDGTQTLNVWRKLNDQTTDALLTIPGLPNQPTDLHLVIDPSYGTVGIRVNSVQYGAFPYHRYASSDQSTSASILTNGNAAFSYLRIREMQPSQ